MLMFTTQACYISVQGCVPDQQLHATVAVERQATANNYAASHRPTNPVAAGGLELKN